MSENLGPLQGTAQQELPVGLNIHLTLYLPTVDDKALEGRNATVPAPGLAQSNILRLIIKRLMSTWSFLPSDFF
jgi:hypothetical protein